MDTGRVDLFSLGSLTFEKPDTDTFPGLKLAYDACRRGGSLPTVFNAANEAAVRMFIDGALKFVEIPEFISACMDHHTVIDDPSVDDILGIESEVRAFAEAYR